MAVNSHLFVFPNIPVATIIRAKRFTSGWSLLSKFSKDTFDYVVCSRKNMEVMCAISFYGQEDKKTNKMMDLSKLYNLANLPFLGYDVKPYRNIQTLRRQILSNYGINNVDLDDGYEQRESFVATGSDADILINKNKFTDKVKTDADIVYS